MRDAIDSVRTAATALILLGTLAWAGPARAHDPPPPPLRCEPVVFFVALAADQPADQRLVAFLCARGPIDHKTIQVLVHGGTYDQLYWDFPFVSPIYSYVDALTRAGYATLSLDRIGAGLSSHPASGSALTLHTAAFTVHQVVTSLRSGRLVVPGFGPVRGERVMLVGHSLGSIAASVEAATYDDVDGVVLSAYAHTIGPGAGTVIASLYPAVDDPKFARFGLAPDYLTTLPGTRGADFYALAFADPDVIAVDELLKDTVTAGELGDIFPSLGASFGIRAPTLVVDGDLDLFFCAPPSCTASGLLASEPANYGPEACVEVQVQPESGHDLNLHPSAPQFFSTVREWSDRRVGASSRHAPPEPCP